jgi:hypothetical protein
MVGEAHRQSAALAGFRRLVGDAATWAEAGAVPAGRATPFHPSSRCSGGPAGSREVDTPVVIGKLEARTCGIDERLMSAVPFLRGCSRARPGDPAKSGAMDRSFGERRS